MYAIRSYYVGLNPAASGETLRVPMPPLTEERRKELIKVVRHEAENARVAVRNLRRDAIHGLKEALKKKEVSENEERRAQDEVQKLTDRSVAEIDRLLEQKESELIVITSYSIHYTKLYELASILVRARHSARWVMGVMPRIS